MKTLPRDLTTSQPLTTLETEAVRDYLHAATSDNTRRTYQSAVRQFVRWGGRLPADRDMVLRYLLERQPELNMRTLDLHITALRQWHEYQQLTDPTRDPLIQKTLEGMRRRHGQPRQKARPLSIEALSALIGWLDQQPLSLMRERNRALLLVAYFGAFRRSELVGLQYGNLEWFDDGVVVTLERSKTDQSGEGMQRALPCSDNHLCPVTALKCWMEAIDPHTESQKGAIFRRINRWDQPGTRAMDASSINLILKKLAMQAGLEGAEKFSSHSFRRGLTTSAAQAGVDFELIRKQGGWKQDATVREYIEEGRALDRNAAKELLQQVK